MGGANKCLSRHIAPGAPGLCRVTERLIRSTILAMLISRYDGDRRLSLKCFQFRMEFHVDETLLKLIESLEGNLPDVQGDSPVGISLRDDATDEIQLHRGEQKQAYTLKPLNELYGPGNSGTVDPQSEVFMPLFLCIEEEIAKFDANEVQLNDATVTLALNRLSMNPEEQTGDALIRRIQMALRLNLSLNNYARQEVRQADRKIGKSVDRHSEGGRGRGYLKFIHEFFGRLGK